MSEANAVTTAETVTSTEPTDAPVVTEASTPSQPQGDKTEAPKKEGGVAKRIKELVEERNTWRERAMRYQGITREQERKEVSQGKPEASKFNSYEDYMEALTDWKVEQRLTERDSKARNENAKQRHQETLLRAAETFEERAEKFRESADDFDDVAFEPSLKVSDAMSEAILDSDIGPQILYHLGQNPKESARIARLTPVAATREILKLEIKLSSPPSKKPSNAPEPITPVGGKEKVSVDMEKMPINEWMKRRNEQLRKK